MSNPPHRADIFRFMRIGVPSAAHGPPSPSHAYQSPSAHDRNSGRDSCRGVVEAGAAKRPHAAKRIARKASSAAAHGNADGSGTGPKR